MSIVTGAPVASTSYATLPAYGAYPGMGSYLPPIDPAQVQELNQTQQNFVTERANVQRTQIQAEAERQAQIIDQQAQHQLTLVRSQIEAQRTQAQTQLQQQLNQQTW